MRARPRLLLLALPARPPSLEAQDTQLAVLPDAVQARREAVARVKRRVSGGGS